MSEATTIKTLRDALALARNRLQACAIDHPTGSREMYERGEWADEATATLRTLEQPAPGLPTCTCKDCVQEDLNHAAKMKDNRVTTTPRPDLTPMTEDQIMRHLKATSCNGLMLKIVRAVEAFHGIGGAGPLPMVDVGDRLTLQEPWTFTLYPERRNATLIHAFGYNDPGGVFDLQRKEAAKITGHHFNTDTANVDEVVYRLKQWANRQAQAKYPGQQVTEDNYPAAALALLEEVRDTAWETTLPTGTSLIVDRVYIRKGASEFSSLSFWVDYAPEDHPNLRVAKTRGFLKKPRFWAKLEDCRRMACKLDLKPIQATP